MGMYTEMIIGCSLVNLPRECAEALNFEINKRQELRTNEDYDKEFLKLDSDTQDFIKNYDLAYIINCDSFYFGAPSISHFHKEKWGDETVWFLSIRSNCKNYSNNIQKFVEFLRPYVYIGSGPKNIYAYMHYEEDDFPVIYNKESLYPIYIKTNETR